MIPNNWPPEIKDILNTLPPEQQDMITDFINLSWQAGFFDGEGSFQWNPVSPIIGSQDIECLQIYLSRHNGKISLQAPKGKIIYVNVKGEKIPVTKYSRNYYQWLLQGKTRGKTSRSYIEKTKFLISILPLQRNKIKIEDTIRALKELKWSGEDRWKHLIPDIEIGEILSRDEEMIRKILEEGEDARRVFT